MASKVSMTTKVPKGPKVQAVAKVSMATKF
jgi:hypothetical protein